MKITKKQLVYLIKESLMEPFERGTKFIYTSPTTGRKIPVTYVRWLGLRYPSLVVVKRTDDKVNYHKFTVHMSTLQQVE